MKHATEVPHLVIHPNEAGLIKILLDENPKRALAEIGEDGVNYLRTRIDGVLRQFEA